MNVSFSLCAREQSQQPHVQTTIFPVLVACNRGSILWRGCDTLCTSGSVGDVNLSIVTSFRKFLQYRVTRRDKWMEFFLIQNEN